MGRFDCGKDTDCLDTIEVTERSDRGDRSDSDKHRYSRRKTIKFKGLTLSTKDTFQFWTLSKGNSRYIAYSIKGKKYLLAEVRKGETIIFDSRDNNGIIVGGYNSKTRERHIFIGFDTTDEIFLKNTALSIPMKTMTVQELLRTNNGNLESLKNNFQVVEELSKKVKNTTSSNPNTDVLGKIKDTMSISENVLKGLIEDENKYREALQKAGRLSETEAFRTATEIKNIFSTRLGLIGKTLTYSEFVDDLKKGYVKGDWSKLEKFTRDTLEGLVGAKAGEIISKLLVIGLNTISNTSPYLRILNSFFSIGLPIFSAYLANNSNISELFTDKSLFNKDGELFSLTKDHYLSASGDITLQKNIRNVKLSGNKNSTITGNNDDNILKGNSGNNILYGNNGNDTLFGDLGNDRLFGGEGNDILEGGKGNDYFEGGEGDDIYQFNFDDGNDTIRDNRGSDKILLKKGIEFEKTYFTLDNNKIKLSFVETNASIIIDRSEKGGFSRRKRYINKNIEINFNNKKTLNYNDIINVINNKNNHIKDKIKYEYYDKKIFSSSKNTNLIGSTGKDFLQGNNKNNYLEGKTGDDIYYFSGAIGNDVIHDENGNDKIYLDESFYGKDILFTKENLDLRLSLPQSNESILIKDFNKTTTRWRGGFRRRRKIQSFNKIEYLQVGNDTVIDLAKLVNEMSSFAINVNGGNLRISDTLEHLHNPNYQSIVS